jgi:hypothetical protein
LSKEEVLDCSFRVLVHFLSLAFTFFFEFAFAIGFTCFDIAKLDQLLIFLSLF